jgi:sarcosine oxidase subunit beta
MADRATTADAIIIGAGIMGVCTAFELARRGLKPIVLEKRFVGAGSSGKSSAVVRQHYSNEVTIRMALRCLRTFQHFDEVVGGECGFAPVGFVLLVDQKDRAGMEENVAYEQSLGVRTEVLSLEAVRELVPGIESAESVAACYEPESGYVDPNLTLNSYVSASKAMGVQVLQEAEVTGVHFDGGRVAGVDSSRGRFSAPVVINCAGPWGSRVARMAGIDLPLNACRVQVAFFRRPPAEGAPPPPVLADFVNGFYTRPETGGLTLAGLIDEDEAKAIVHPDRYNEEADFDFVADIGERLARRSPYMERSVYTGGYGALYEITPDWHPVIDEVPAGSGCFICAGFSGHGFKEGPAVGIIMADLVTRNPSPEFDARLFRFSRFAEGDPVRGRYEYSIVG